MEGALEQVSFIDFEIGLVTDHPANGLPGESDETPAGGRNL